MIAKPLKINPNYLLYPNGKCFSIQSMKFLKPIAIPQDSGKIHYAYDIKPINNISKRRKHIIARLVYFEFGKHNYKTLDQLPDISYKNRKSQHYGINNLECIGTQGVLEKYKIGHNSKFNGKSKPGNSIPKIPATEKKKIKSLIKKGNTNDSISKLYNVSPMSITRFRKRHKI